MTSTNIHGSGREEEASSKNENPEVGVIPAIYKCGEYHPSLVDKDTLHDNEKHIDHHEDRSNLGNCTRKSVTILTIIDNLVSGGAE